MIVTSSAIKNGYFDDKYGKRGNDTEKKVPLLSFPFEIAEEPEGTDSGRRRCRTGGGIFLDTLDGGQCSQKIYTRRLQPPKQKCYSGRKQLGTYRLRRNDTAEHDTPL